MTLYFKALGAGRRSCHGGAYTYPEPGEWTPPVTPILCSAGYHLVKPRGLLAWLHEELWLAEGRGESGKSSDGKITFESVRLVRQLPWDARVARLFACDCAERALERERAAGREPAPESWAAVSVAGRFALGDATDSELSAARSAASSAASIAARSAASSAARSAAWSAASSAAWSAAESAADRAAWSAAWSAASSAADRAAWNAASSAAWSAACAACAACATRGAAWNAAERAECVWQTRRLMEHYLGVRLVDAWAEGEA